MKVLAIETSCDETAAAIVESDEQNRGSILANIVWSQIEQHQDFGGVVPEIAARAHVEKLDYIIKEALAKAKLSFASIDGVAVSVGPGLIGGLMVGLISAKAICLALNKPLLAINHLEAHALTARLTDWVAYPYLLLLVSGGHTQLLIVEELGKYQRLGSTIDDALGETFDKLAKLLELGYPGGPAIEKYGLKGDAQKYKFPHPLKGQDHYNFSFSGLKNALRLCIERLKENNELNEQAIADICASFQFTIGDILRDRVSRAMDLCKTIFRTSSPCLVVAGGVAANQYIKQILTNLAQQENFEIVIPTPSLCTDNAAMVAWAGCEYLKAGIISDLDVAARARWPLDKNSIPLLGSGKKGAKA